MKLTYNTLLHVISLSWYMKDAVQPMATCRVLYHKGPKIALKKTVFISTAEQLASFLKFLHADNSSRCRYLRQLELYSCSLDPGVVQELIETLPLLTGIEYLRLVEAEELLDLHPALSPAFSDLQSPARPKSPGSGPAWRGSSPWGGRAGLWETAQAQLGPSSA